MSSNYDQIRADNIKEYGEGTRHLAFLSRLYSDRTHFVFELLQNAEDVGATKISFSLHADYLEVRHNGRDFNEADVRGVCGVDEGTKAGDFTKIGKFGIGFKSVYAYTRRPEIHSGPEHFYIENYIRPFLAEPRSVGDAWTTLFLFGFDHSEIAAAQAYEEIQNRLRSLSVRTLLFLEHIMEIEWKVEGSAAGIYLREEAPGAGLRRVKLLGHSEARQDEDEEWLVFERAVQPVEHSSPLKVAVAYKVGRDSKTGREIITAISDSNLVVFFPTEKPTNLGFLVQGPFRTTPARDNIPQDDKINQQLIEQLASLVAKTLADLRILGLLTVEVLEAMPIRPAHFPRGSMFRPIYDRVRETLQTQALLPIYGGAHAAGVQVKLARGTELLELLNPRQLGELLGRKDLVYWLSGEITAVRTPDLYKYIVGRPESKDDIAPLVAEVEFRPEILVTRLTAAFIARQDDTWVTRLYGFLGGQTDLWSRLRAMPILRLEDGQHVSLQRRDGGVGAYLPSEEPTEFPTVKRDIAKEPKANQFLKGLGLKEPDAVDEVIEKVLPKYQGAEIAVSAEEHRADIRKILKALATTEHTRRVQLLAEVKATNCVLVTDAGVGIGYYVSVEFAYLKNTELALYFEANPDAYFLWDGYSTEERAGICEWGVPAQVRVRCRASDYKGLVSMVEEHGQHLRGLDGFDLDCEIDGLAYALEHITLEKAIYIWNELLLHNKHQIKGITEFSTRRSYENPTRNEVYSPLGQLVRGSRWLPDRQGVFRLPGEISPDDLPAGFEPDSTLSLQLGMQLDKIALYAQALGLASDDIQFLKEYPAEFDRLKRTIRERNAGVIDLDEEEASGVTGTLDLNYQEELVKSFERPGRERTDERLAATDLVSNPARRRETVGGEIEAAIVSEPELQKRFKRVPQKVWEAKDNSVRMFLLEEYGGRCQICGDKNAFVKGSGEPYFAGVYMVSHTKARWIDRPGNVLCLCATCCAKFEYGAVVAEDVVDQVLAFRTRIEGGQSEPRLKVQLCGEVAIIQFNERHILDLQELLKASSNMSR